MEIKSFGKFLKRNPVLAVFNGLLAVVFLLLFFSGGFAGEKISPETSASETGAIVFENRLLPNQEDPLYLSPIFHTDRHPAKEPRAPIQAVVETPFRLELTGVLSVSDEIGWAFFRQTNGQEAHQVPLGETIDGWTLERLGDNEVTLSKGEARKTLSLNNPLALGSAGANGQGTATAENPDQNQKPRTRKRK